MIHATGNSFPITKGSVAWILVFAFVAYVGHPFSTVWGFSVECRSLCNKQHLCQHLRSTRLLQDYRSLEPCIPLASTKKRKTHTKCQITLPDPTWKKKGHCLLGVGSSENLWCYMQSISQKISESSLYFSLWSTENVLWTPLLLE